MPGQGFGLQKKAASFPAGTKMLFKQSTAPVKWTIDDTITDKSAMRYTRSGSFGADAGSVDLATGVSVTQGHALTVAELAVHNHPHSHTVDAADNAGTGKADALSGSTTSTFNTNSASVNAGSGNSHNHDIELRYTDVIVATKD